MYLPHTSPDLTHVRSLGVIQVRALEKRLRQIAELKELKAGGKELEKNQLDKIVAEEAVKQELDELAKKMEELGNVGKWR